MEKINALDRMLVAMAKNDPVCRLLTTVPGVGTLTAVLFKPSLTILPVFLDQKMWPQSSALHRESMHPGKWIIPGASRNAATPC